MRVWAPSADCKSVVPLRAEPATKIGRVDITDAPACRTRLLTS